VSADGTAPGPAPAELDVSRETAARLETYAALLAKWNARINLVAPDTIPAFWNRHIADSLQLLDLAPPEACSWIDLGAGAGLPGLPVAALAAERAPELRLTLVESNTRKAGFIATAARAMDVAVRVEARRIKDLPPRPYDVVSARALAPLDRLCALAHPFFGAGSVGLFPKGARLDSELTAATAAWHIRAERIASRTEPDAVVLRILELHPRP